VKYEHNISESSHLKPWQFSDAAVRKHRQLTM